MLTGDACSSGHLVPSHLGLAYVLLVETNPFPELVVIHFEHSIWLFVWLSALVGCWSSVFIKMIIYRFLDVCPFDYTAFAVSGKVGIPLTGLTTKVGWLSLLQLTVRIRSAIIV